MKRININKWYIGIVLLTTACTSQKIDRTSAPKPAKASQINIGEPKEFTLDNGLKVFLVEDHRLPKVSFQLSFDNDPVLEKDKVGLGQMTGDLMVAGTQNRTKEEIDNEIDFIGASFVPFSGGMYMSSLSKHTDKLLDIAGDILQHPVFPKEELEKQKRKAISSLKTVSTNANAIASRVGGVLVYGKNHPYGEVQTKSDVENITVEDCKQYYQTYLRPNISHLIVVGDITEEEAKAKAEKYFGGWEKKQVPTYTYPFPKQPEENRVVFVEKPGAVQSLVQVLYPVDYKLGQEDDIAVKVMSSVFGGAFSSYLNANLREDKGYTYGARGGVYPDVLVGKFSASASVRNEVTDSSIVEFLKEMQHIREEKVKQEDLSRIKNKMNGNFALSLEKPRTIARFAYNIARYNLPKDYYKNYLTRLEAVTDETVQQAAKKYIFPQKNIILVVGNKDILEKLKPFDSDGIVEVYDYNGEPKKELKPVTNGMTAEKVIEQYLFVRTDLTDMNAVKEKFNAIKDITIETEAKMQGMTIKMISKQLAPNLISTEVSMNGMTIQKQVFDGEKGVSSGMQGQKDIEGKELEYLKMEAEMHKETKYKELGYTLELLGIENILGQDAYKVEITTPLGEKETQYFSLKDGLLIYRIQNVEGEDGKVITSTTEYNDYKKVNGILYPFKRSEQAGPQNIDLEVKSIKHNQGLTKADFK